MRWRRERDEAFARSDQGGVPVRDDVNRVQWGGVGDDPRSGKKDDLDRPGSVVVRYLDPRVLAGPRRRIVVVVVRGKVPVHGRGVMVAVVDMPVHMLRRKNGEPGQANDGGQ